MNALLLSMFLVLTPPADRSIFNRGVDPVWLCIGIAIGSVLSGFAVTGIFLATTPRAFSR